MTNILFLTANVLLKSDLTAQIEYCLPEYKVFTEDNEETVFDLALLDGKSWLVDFRAKHSKVPALILEPADSSEFTENNLDIFIYKPLILASLLNQIKSTINVFANSADGTLYFDPYELHPEDRSLINTLTDKAIKLTEREIDILAYLYKAGGKLVSKEELLENVWEYSPETTTHTIETHIYRLRKKIDDDESAAPLIVAEDGGYRLEI